MRDSPPIGYGSCSTNVFLVKRKKINHVARTSYRTRWYFILLYLALADGYRVGSFIVGRQPLSLVTANVAYSSVCPGPHRPVDQRSSLGGGAWGRRSIGHKSIELGPTFPELQERPRY